MKVDPKFSSIMIIDDNPADIFFHRRTIDKLEITDHVHVFIDADEALLFLKNMSIAIRENQQILFPEVILLDLNMPQTDGWDFLETYWKTIEEFPQKPIIIILTTSINPKDRKRAMEIGMVHDFFVKPLDQASLNRIILNFFPDRIV